MDSKELRIGDLIQMYRHSEDDEMTYHEVVELYKDEHLGYVISIRDGFICNILTGIEPIPLTEEWLIKFGFEKGSNSSQGGAIHRGGVYLGIMGMSPNYTYCFNAESSTNKAVYIKCVHQLQNLYFALTSEELIIV